MPTQKLAEGPPQQFTRALLADHQAERATQIASGLAQAKDDYWAQEVDILRSASAAGVAAGKVGKTRL